MTKQTKQKTLMLVDGNSLINRAFYGLLGRQNLSAPDGTPTGAVYAFLNMFLNFRKEIKPDGIGVAFDLPGKTFRHEKFADYKGKRSPTPEELIIQIPMLKELLDALNVKRLEKETYEADDLIGTYSRRAAENGFKVYIVTGDKDSLQLIDDDVTIVLPITKKGKTDNRIMNRETFREEYGIDPEQFVDLKALMGDSSDNIPGVKGIGIKTGLKLMQEYGSLDNIYEHLDELPKGQRNKLNDNRDMAYLSQDLSEIYCDVPLPIALEDLKSEPIDAEKTAEFFSRYGFESMLDRFELEPVAEPYDPARIRDLQALDSLLLDGENATRRVAVYPKSDDDIIFLVEGVGYLRTDAEHIKKHWQELKEHLGISIFEDYKRFLRTYGLEPLRVQPFDCSIAAYILLQDAEDNFERLYQATTNEVWSVEVEVDGDPLTDAEQDLRRADALFAIELSQRAEIREQGIETLAYAIEMPLAGVLAEMEARGVLINEAALDDVSAKMLDEIDALEKKIFSIAEEPFNLNSTKALSAFLFDQLKLTPGKKLSGGYYSTAASELERLRPEHPVIDDILEYREVSKLRSTFVEGFKKYIEDDGRIHTTFNQTLTSTGRLSSSNPNLQNIPIRSERSGEIRRIFVADEGKCLLSADYSQIELRLLAHMSGDENLLTAFNDYIDIHANTATQLFDKPADQITSAERSAAKTVNFSILYGISPYGLSRDMGTSMQKAKDYIEAYHEHYPGVKPYLDGILAFAKENGYVETLFHRRRAIPQLKSAAYNIRQFGERAAMNAPIQGTAADLIKIAMNRLKKKLKDNLSAEELKENGMILQVHDELILEVEEKNAERIGAWLKEAMEGAMELKVPLIADVYKGQNWNDMKAIDA